MTARELILDYLGRVKCARLSDIMPSLNLRYSTAYMALWKLIRSGAVYAVIDPFDMRRRIYCIDKP